MYTLVIIDMQEGFEASFEPNVVAGVTQEILLAKSLKLPILVVEFSDNGDTHYGLMRLIAGYNRKAKVAKIDDDGSDVIIRALRRKKFPKDMLRICGVNTDCCVLATIVGLIRKNPTVKIQVPKHACNTSERFDWRTYPKYKNLELV
jgi:nicotinamidase-related amidase